MALVPVSWDKAALAYHLELNVNASLMPDIVMPEWLLERFQAAKIRAMKHHITDPSLYYPVNNRFTVKPQARIRRRDTQFNQQSCLVPKYSLLDSPVLHGVLPHSVPKLGGSIDAQRPLLYGGRS